MPYGKCAGGIQLEFEAVPVMLFKNVTWNSAVTKAQGLNSTGVLKQP
jgi:hypothetical protein